MRSRTVRRWAAVLALATAAPALAQEAQAPKRSERPQKLQTVGEWAYKRLQAAHELIANEQYAAAREKLDEMARRERLNDYERAQMWQTYAYIETTEGDYAKAIEAFEKCLALDALPDAARRSIEYNLAQLYMAAERYPDAIRRLEAWVLEEPAPKADAYYMLALAYLQQGDFAKTRDHIERAVSLVKEPARAWLQLLLAARFEQKDYAGCVSVLQELIQRYPEKGWFNQLAGIYAQLGENEKSLATLELAYRAGQLVEGGEVERLAQRYLYQDLPYKAGVVLQQGLADGILEADEAHLKLLGEAWLAARETERAIEPLSQAAVLAEGGEVALRLARVHVERQEWSRARELIELALEKGGLADPGQAQVLLGIVYYNAKRPEEAQRAFARAANDPKSANAAQGWLKLLRQEAALQ